MKKISKKEIIISSLIILIAISIFIFSLQLKKTHKKYGDMICFFKKINIQDTITVTIYSNSFAAPVLTSSCPPPESIYIELKGLRPGTLEIIYSSTDSENSIDFDLYIEGEKVNSGFILSKEKIRIPFE